MMISGRQQNGVEIVMLSGCFIKSDAPSARRYLSQVIANNAKLIIDMSAVTYIDVSACAAIVFALQAMQARSGKLLLVTNALVQSFIELTRLHSIFDIVPSVDHGLLELAH